MPWARLDRTQPAEAIPPETSQAAQPFAFRMERLARVTVGLERQPISVGETPDGLRIDFPLGEGGTVAGPRLNGTFLHSGETGCWSGVTGSGSRSSGC